MVFVYFDAFLWFVGFVVVCLLLDGALIVLDRCVRVCISFCACWLVWLTVDIVLFRLF